MSEKKQRKKPEREKNTLDKVTDVFIIFIVIAAACFIAALTMEGYKNRQHKNEKQETALTGTAEPEATQAPLPEGVVRYDNSISTGEGKNDTEFYLLFDYNDNTYTEMVRAAQLEDALDEGTFEDTDGVIITKSTKNEEYTERYYKDGDYIVPVSGLFEGEISEGSSIEAECVQESKDYTTTITFYKNGQYGEVKTAKTKGVSDTSRGGNYKVKGSFISRTSAEGESLLDLYIYKNRLANAYFKIAE